LFSGYGWAPVIVAGHEPDAMHDAMAAALDAALDRLGEIHAGAGAGAPQRPAWPMIILRSPKGWTGPKEVDGKPVEGTWRAHQVPLDKLAEHPERLAQLEEWLRSYGPEELFDADGQPVAAITAQAPHGDRRLGMNPHANGGLLLRDLVLPDYGDYALAVDRPGGVQGEATHVLGEFLRDIMAANPTHFRLFGPDETASNKLDAVFAVTSRASMAEILPTDDHVAPDGRVMEVLSEHLCQGWLEGYLLTGRHGLFSCYEAFIHIVDSMFNQHAKWLEATQKIPWRRPVASLNYLLTSHVWRQDHNGFSHQDPGFIGHVMNKKASVVRVYLPPDANTLLSVADHCLRSRNYVNVIVAGKQPSPQWMSLEAARRHCAAGIGLWPWAGNDGGREPDVVMACAGDVPTLETMAAVALLREHMPFLKLRVVNVVDLMALLPRAEHPHGLSDAVFESLFTADKPVIFAFHGYPWMVHRLIHGRACAMRFHVHGYREEGTTTTPFDMTVLNGLDRFTLAMAAIERVPHAAANGGNFVQHLRDRLADHRVYVCAHGEDMPEIRDWQWRDFDTLGGEWLGAQ
jgi:xylulose-5-phosphate/fructose-6-phosphate phosphoketolase